MESDIIIVNHHLFFADLAIKPATEYAPDAGILPEVGVVIFDEAHELEDVAGSYFGVSVSNQRMDELARDVEASLHAQQNPVGRCGRAQCGVCASARNCSSSAAAAGRRAIRLREPARVPGRKW